MNQVTIDQINLINKDFYSKISSQWNQKLDSKWMGWNRLITHIKNNFENKDIIRILDLGCGNGRFATFLNANLKQKIEYTGVDFDTFFLQQAKDRDEYTTQNTYNTKKFNKFDLIDLDLTKDNLTKIFINKGHNQKYDLVVLFGLIHHIASKNSRLQLLNLAKSCLDDQNTNGLLVWTSWRFLDQPRLLKRVVDLDSPLGQQIIKDNNLDIKQLEIGDHFLSWVKHDYAIRFSHYINEQEGKNLINSTNLKLLDYYVDDSITQNLNGYYICGRTV